MKKIILLMAALFTFGAISQAFATITATQVGSLDLLIAAGDVTPENEATEALWISNVLGLDPVLTKFDVVRYNYNPFEVVEGGLSGQWAFKLTSEDGYFLVKTGSNGDFTHWLFKNLDSSLYATVVHDMDYYLVDYGSTQTHDDYNDDSVISGTQRFNPSDIDSISHVTFTSAPVPEPATMLLFGTGLIGLAGARLRRKKV